MMQRISNFFGVNQEEQKPKSIAASRKHKNHLASQGKRLPVAIRSKPSLNVVTSKGKNNFPSAGKILLGMALKTVTAEKVNDIMFKRVIDINGHIVEGEGSVRIWGADISWLNVIYKALSKHAECVILTPPFKEVSFVQYPYEDICSGIQNAPMIDVLCNIENNRGGDNCKFILTAYSCIRDIVYGVCQSGLEPAPLSSTGSAPEPATAEVSPTDWIKGAAIAGGAILFLATTGYGLYKCGQSRAQRGTAENKSLEMSSISATDKSDVATYVPLGLA